MQQEAERTPMTRHDVLQRIREYFGRPGAVFGYDNDLGVCVYRGDDDPHSPIRCAVGVLIPDDVYSPRFEQQTVFEIWDDISHLFADDVTEAWLDDVQCEHDLCVNGDDISQFLLVLKRKG